MIRDETLYGQDASSPLRDSLLRSIQSGSNPVRFRSGDGDTTQDAGECISFSLACRHLLGLLFSAIPASRGFFLLRAAPSAEDQSVEPLTVLCAVTRDDIAIEHPDYHLDHHYLREVGVVDGARFLSGAEDGASRPLLTCSFALESGTRGLVLLDSEPGAGGLKDSQTADIEEAIESARFDLQWLYLLDPRAQEIDRLRGQLEVAERQIELQESENGGGRSLLEDEPRGTTEVIVYHDIITRSATMHDMIEVIERIKDTDLSTLISGETGTGKELVARSIHFGGSRAMQPFEVVGCGSLSVNLLESELFGYRKGAFSGAETDRKGVFERAHGGTVFLDEVADMPSEMQKKILRVLQEKVIRPIGAEEPVQIDVRVIASTQQDLSSLVQQRTFREDLYYRLNVINLDVPPLRDRREDIPVLVDHFLKERAEEEEITKRFSDSARRELYQYAWPGNVQELRNVVTRAFLSSPRRVISRRVVTPLLKSTSTTLLSGDGLVQDGDTLALTIPFSEGFNNLIGECEKLILLNALRRNRGNKSRVTQQLRIPRQTLYNKLEKYGIVESDYMDHD